MNGAEKEASDKLQGCEEIQIVRNTLEDHRDSCPGHAEYHGEVKAALLPKAAPKRRGKCSGNAAE